MSDKRSNHINDILKGLPLKPGVYQYYDKDGNILYVGKAKKLKNRVTSYFTGTQIGKTRVLVSKIVDIKYIVVPTEQDALLLENNLIKQYRPPYNILLKDDKTYPWICVKNERFPRVFSTRKVIKDGSVYFGPYTSVRMVRTLLDFVHKVFPLRNCNYDLSTANVANGKYRVCLEYHVGNCKGACEGLEAEEAYNDKIRQIKSILRGNITDVKDYLNAEMLRKAKELDFEGAQFLKESLFSVEEYQSKNTVVSNTISNVDVFGFYSSTGRCFVNYFKIIDGAIIQSHTAEAKVTADDSESDILIYYILYLREEFNSTSREVIVPIELEYDLPDVNVVVPQIGDKKKLVDLSSRNAKFYGLDKIKNSTSLVKIDSNTRILEELKKRLHLPDLPLHIECFDNSNIQGTHPVSACVVFKNGKPSKKDYRHFNIKTVEGPNDFASMEEALERRYSRMVRDGESLPNLIIIDGGKGQLSSSVAALERLGLLGKIPIIGIAKRLEEIFFPGDSFPIYIDKKSEALKLIQHLRNEAHRFGITHHRNRRSTAMTVSELDGITGVGEKTRSELLRVFKSVSKVKEATKEELGQIVGKSRGAIIYNYFNKSKLN